MKVDSISVVIPAYNEEKTIKDVVKDATLILKKLKVDYEIILVNDGSTDDTGKIIDKLARSTRIRAVHHKKNKGFTGAMRTCFASARKGWVFLAPADGQFDFSQVSRFTKAIDKFDVALGYRIKNEESLSRKLMSKLFHILCRILFGIKFKEISTVSLWRRSVLQSISIISDDQSAMMLPELIFKAMKKNYQFTEVPISWRTRRGGKAKGAGFVTIAKTLVGMSRLWYIIHR